MAKVLVSLVLLLSMTCYSNGFYALDAHYCVCKDGVSNSSLEYSFAWACDIIAGCLAIFRNRTCYDLMTPKSRCDYAVNSYYQIVGKCNFNGLETTSDTTLEIPHGCVQQLSPGPVAGRGRHHFGQGALPPDYIWTGTGPQVDPLPETGAAAALVGNLSFFNPVLLSLTGGLLILL